MKFRLNLEPTIRLERFPSRSFQAALAGMVLIPSLVFACIALKYADCLRLSSEVDARSTELGARLQALRKKMKSGLRIRALRKSVEAKRTLLMNFRSDDEARAALLLARLEETMGPEVKLASLDYKRSAGLYRVHLKGSARNAEAMALLVEELYGMSVDTVTVNQVLATGGQLVFDVSGSGPLKALSARMDTHGKRVPLQDERQSTVAPLPPSRSGTGPGDAAPGPSQAPASSDDDSAKVPETANGDAMNAERGTGR